MNVSLKTLSGDIYNIKVSKDETCEQLKAKIENLLDFPPNEQKLFYERGYLDKSNEKLITYGIKDGSIIYISFYPKEFDVRVLRFSVELTKIKTNSGTLVKNLKTIIENQHSISIGEQILLYNGQILDDNESLFNSGITDTCIITLIPKIQKKTVENLKVARVLSTKLNNRFLNKQIDSDLSVPIRRNYSKSSIKTDFYNYLNKKSYGLQLNTNEKIKDIKSNFLKSPSVCESVNEYNGAILDDNKKLNEYGIVNSSFIEVYPKMNDEIEIICKTIDGEMSSVYINLNDKISMLKKKIFEKIGIELIEQRLVYNGILLDDDNKIKDHGLQAKSKITVVRKQKNKIKINLKTLNGKTITLFINGDEKISQIKKLIQEKIKALPETQKLVLLNKVLEDDLNIRDYFYENVPIYIVIRSL